MMGQILDCWNSWMYIMTKKNRKPASTADIKHASGMTRFWQNGFPNKNIWTEKSLVARLESNFFSMTKLNNRAKLKKFSNPATKHATQATSTSAGFDCSLQLWSVHFWHYQKLVVSHTAESPHAQENRGPTMINVWKKHLLLLGVFYGFSSALCLATSTLKGKGFNTCQKLKLCILNVSNEGQTVDNAEREW